MPVIVEVDGLAPLLFGGPGEQAGRVRPALQRLPGGMLIEAAVAQQLRALHGEAPQEVEEAGEHEGHRRVEPAPVFEQEAETAEGSLVVVLALQGQAAEHHQIVPLDEHPYEEVEDQGKADEEHHRPAARLGHRVEAHDQGGQELSGGRPVHQGGEHPRLVPNTCPSGPPDCSGGVLPRARPLEDVQQGGVQVHVPVGGSSHRGGDLIFLRLLRLIQAAHGHQGQAAGELHAQHAAMRQAATSRHSAV